MTLELLIRDQTMYRLDKSKVVGGSVNYLFAHFTFPDDWVGTRVATFTLVNDSGTSDPISYTLDDNDRCPVPPDLIHAGTLRISACCVDSDNNKRIPSNIVSVVIPTDGDADAHGIIPPTPTPQFYGEVMEQLDGKFDKTGGTISGNINVDGNINADMGELSVMNIGAMRIGATMMIADFLECYQNISAMGMQCASTPSADTDVVNKMYLDDMIGSIDTALDGIISLQNSLIGGAQS